MKLNTAYQAMGLFAIGNTMGLHYLSIFPSFCYNFYKDIHLIIITLTHRYWYKHINYTADVFNFIPNLYSVKYSLMLCVPDILTIAIP